MTPLVAYCVMPTAMAGHVPETLDKWKARGYRLALFADLGKSAPRADILITAKYPGVWNACNAAAKAAFALDADVCVFAGDDMDPDPNFTAQEIAAQYLERFPSGFGLMQPCGDPQGVDAGGKPAAARICGSAWFGRRWVAEAYGGRGPTPGYYWHFYGDEDMAQYAERLGVMWWRPDLQQFHRHWSWGHNKKQDYHEKNQAHWNADQETFRGRKEAGFP